MCAAHLLKALAFAGLRPSLDVCVACGGDVEAVRESGLMALSYREGGVVCAACRSSVETEGVPAAAVAWCRALMSSTFAEIEISRRIRPPRFPCCVSASSGRASTWGRT